MSTLPLQLSTKGTPTSNNFTHHRHRTSTKHYSPHRNRPIRTVSTRYRLNSSQQNCRKKKPSHQIVSYYRRRRYHSCRRSIAKFYSHVRRTTSNNFARETSIHRFDCTRCSSSHVTRRHPIDTLPNRPKTSSQLMGNLPAARVTPSRAFSSSGVDYAGPFDIRAAYDIRVAHKGFIAVFICMSTRAIHLEAVSDLITAAFIAALHRFIARRGFCHDIYSDCGTNFIGANNELRRNTKLNRQLIEYDIMPFLSTWEAAVKSAKNHLQYILRNTTFTFEELSTVLCQIEACLNSRPLAPLSDDPNDCSALTPGHFLIFDSLLAAPTKPTNQLSVHDRWQLLQIIVQHFWQRWSTKRKHEFI